MDNLEKLGAGGKWLFFQEQIQKEMPEVDEEIRRNIAAVRMLVSLTSVTTGALERCEKKATSGDTSTEKLWLT